MGIKNEITVFLALCFFVSCNNSDGPNKRVIVIIDSFPVTKYKTLYIYRFTTLFHEGSESYLAIGKNSCEIYDTSTTFARSRSSAYIDTVIYDSVFLKSKFNVNFDYYPDSLKFKISEIMPQDSYRRRLRRIVDKTCN